jgi:hypothetical protein
MAEGNHHEPCRAHRDPRLGFGVRRSVDHDQIHGTDPIVDPLRRAPARQCGKIKTDSLCPEPRAAQIDPSREAALRIDIKCRNPFANPTSMPSPVVLTMRPWCSAIFGSMSSRRGWRYPYRAAPGLSQPIYRLSDRGCRLSDLLALEADGVLNAKR